MLTATELGAFIDSKLTRSAFRLEVLPHYDVSSDGEDFEAYQHGDPEPDPERKGPWLQRLREYGAAGIDMTRVHVVERPLTPYLQYECEWGYVPNCEAGETIGILDTTDAVSPRQMFDHDFWLIDDTYVIRMHYDDEARFLGGELLDEDALPAYRDARDTALALAEPFPDWWARYPEEGRRLLR